jgi:hypothetical protein
MKKLNDSIAISKLYRVAFPPESTYKLNEVYTYDKADDEI